MHKEEKLISLLHTKIFGKEKVLLKYNESLAGEYLKYFKQMEEKFSSDNDIKVSTLSRYPEVLTMKEQVFHG